MDGTASVSGADAAGGEGASCDGSTDTKWGPLPATTTFGAPGVYTYLEKTILVDFSSKGGPSDL